MFERIAGEAARLMRMHDKRTMTAQVLCLAKPMINMRKSHVKHAEGCGGQGSILHQLLAESMSLPSNLTGKVSY